MAGSIKTYTWTLVRLSLLLMLFGILACIPLGIIIAVFPERHTNHSFQLSFILISIVYLVFIKFALANPLVVVENMLARNAVSKSWEMTKGRFWYVLGCYVFLGGEQYFLTRLSSSIEPKNHRIVTSIANRVVSDYLDSFWILTGWCMYHRIKAVDGSSALSPLESHSAPQSA